MDEHGDKELCCTRQLKMLNVWALLKMKTERWIFTFQGVQEKLSKAKPWLNRHTCVGSKLNVLLVG